MTHIKETEACFDKLDDMKKQLMSWTQAEIAKGVHAVDGQELGCVVDMIEDLTEAQKDIWESCYYKTIVDAMKKAEEQPDLPIMPREYQMGGYRMGYNPNRNSMGQYSDGRGRSGYDEPYWMAGYSDGQGGRGDRGENGGSGNSGNSNSSQSGRQGYSPDVYSRMMDDGQERYGREFERYRQARRGYTETHSENDRKKMKEHGMHHLNEAISTFKEMWDSADPELRQKMKTDLTKLMGEMN